jgi:hypothetical protein
VALFSAEAGLQECLYDVPGKLESDYTGTQTQNIDVVMDNTLVSGITVVTDPGADPWKFVGGYAYAYAAAAYQDAAPGTARMQGLGHFCRQVGIIGWFLRENA